MTVGKHIRNAREQLGLSLRQVASLIEINHTIVHAWETDRAPIPRDRLAPLCNILGVSLSVAFGLWQADMAARDRATLLRAEARLAARRAV